MAVTRRAGTCEPMPSAASAVVKWRVMATTETHAWAIFSVMNLAAVSFTESWRQKPIGYRSGR